MVSLYRQAYSKLIEGSDPRGPIVGRTEHDVTSRSADYPSGLGRYSQPSHFFDNWSGVSLAVASGWATHGAFLYQVVEARDGTPYGLFARLQPRSEGGQDGSGRKFTHCVTLACPVDQWRPGLVLAAYEMLFPPAPDDGLSEIGEPDTSDTPADVRMSEPMVEITPDTLARMEADLGPPAYWRIKQDEDTRFVINADFTDAPPQGRVVEDTVRFLAELNRDFPASFLPFGIGLGFGTTGFGAGFALSVYAKDQKVSTVKTKFHTAGGQPVPEASARAAHFEKGKLNWRDVLTEEDETKTTPAEDTPEAEPEPKVAEPALAALAQIPAPVVVEPEPAPPTGMQEAAPPPGQTEPAPHFAEAAAPVWPIKKAGPAPQNTPPAAPAPPKAEPKRAPKVIRPQMQDHQANARHELTHLARILKSSEANLNRNPQDFLAHYDMRVDTFLDLPESNAGLTLARLKDRLSLILSYWKNGSAPVPQEALEGTFDLLERLSIPFDALSTGPSHLKDHDAFHRLLMLAAFDKSATPRARYDDILQISADALKSAVAPRRDAAEAVKIGEHPPGDCSQETWEDMQLFLDRLYELTSWISNRSEFIKKASRNRPAVDAAKPVASAWLDSRVSALSTPKQL